MASDFPVVDCMSCARTCGTRCNATFLRSWLFAWAKQEPLPECPDYQEKYWRGPAVVR